MTPVLLVTGPVGVGKSQVLHKADSLLIKAGVPHATVVLEEIARCWPMPADHRESETMVYRNLATLWTNFAARGAERLLLEQLVEERAQLRRLCAAIPGSQLIVVRLHAPLSLIEERLHGREPDPADELDAARWLAPRMEQSAIEDHLVENGRRPLQEVASEVLRLAGWLP